MGEHQIEASRDGDRLRVFMRALLEDLRALERMIDEGRIESEVRRIGAEQEMFLVDAEMQPALAAQRILERTEDPALTTELGLFNLEANLDPLVLEGDCLSRMEAGIVDRVERAREAARACDADVLLVGILPTIRMSHLGLESMTPSPRYRELNRVMTELRGGAFRALIKGLDELQAQHDNVMLEACNTSFQIHFQVGAAEFPSLYNLAQAVTAPVLAASVNSPILLQHRLWQETRVALFQQSLDARSQAHQARGTRQRVSFGKRWIDHSVLEILRDDIARYKVLIAGELDESPSELLDRGETPRLRALCLHNGTVYRWNRPCYGVQDGVAHLRIENRALPSGPTVQDEVANAAFYFGLMSAVESAHGDMREAMEFDHVRGNFMAAARYGLDARLTWADGRTWAADALIIDHLLPLAHEGLASHGIVDADRERFLGLLERRVRSGRTGAKWALDSWSAMEPDVTREARCRALTAAMHANERSGRPVHEWELAPCASQVDVRTSFRTVRQIMSTDLFTVHPEDLVDLAANVMDWEHLRHVPVEDDEGNLVGLVSHRRILRLVAWGLREEHGTRPVSELMKRDPVTVTPDTTSLEAIRTMREQGVSCLPVVEDERLVGIVTEHDFIKVAAGLLEEKLREDGTPS